MNKYLLILILLVSPNTFAEVNKWVDSNNRVHYSDQPPPVDAKSATPAKPKTPAPASDSEEPAGKSDTVTTIAPNAPKTIAEREADLKKAAKEKQEAAEKAAKKKAYEDSLKASCTSAKQNLKALQDGVRIMEYDANGERIILDDSQREQRTAKAQKDVSDYCK